MAYKEDIKPYFETGDYPTQTQFYEFLDKIRWKDEKIGSSDLTTELLAIINSFGRTVVLPITTYSYLAKAGTLIEKFVLSEWPNAHAAGPWVFTIRIGLTPGGNELIENTEVDVADDPNSGILGVDHFCLADTTIYFTVTPPIGAVADYGQIKIYKS